MTDIKKCSKCHKYKNITDFYKMKSRYKNKVYKGYRGACKPCTHIDSMTWIKNNREQYRRTHRNYRTKRKIKLLEDMGGKCICCGCTQYWNMTFDHLIPIKRKAPSNTSIVPKLINDKEFRKKFQLLCYGCNNSKSIYEKCVINHKLKINFEENKDE